MIVLLRLTKGGRQLAAGLFVFQAPRQREPILQKRDGPSAHAPRGQLIRLQEGAGRTVSMRTGGGSCDACKAHDPRARLQFSKGQVKDTFRSG